MNGPKLDALVSRGHGSAMRMVAVISGKGGSGKTMVASSLAYLLAHLGFRTLLVDADIATGGLSYFLRSAYPRHAAGSVTDYLRQRRRGHNPRGSAVVSGALIIPEPYCDGNLVFLPAFDASKDDEQLDGLESPFEPMAGEFVDLCQSLRSIEPAQLDFSFVIVDTQGGAGSCALGCAMGSDGYITVTEADKTSWEVTRRLLASLAHRAASGHKSLELGFILNKNVLPPEAIVSFLTQRWNCPHLATVPLDLEAMRDFVLAKVPVVEHGTGAYAAGLLPVIRRVYVSEAWSSEPVWMLKSLEEEVSKAVAARKRERSRARSRRWMLVWMRSNSALVTLFCLSTLWIVLREQRTQTVGIMLLSAMTMTALTTAVDMFTLFWTFRGGRRVPDDNENDTG